MNDVILIPPFFTYLFDMFNMLILYLIYFHMSSNKFKKNHILFNFVQYHHFPQFISVKYVLYVIENLLNLWYNSIKLKSGGY